MKYNIKHTFALMLAAAGLSACSDIVGIEPLGSSMLDSQLKETVAANPSRVDAAFNAIYTYPGNPIALGYTSDGSYIPINFGFIAAGFEGDFEGPDLTMPNNNYNWFSPSGELQSRNLDYFMAYIPYETAYAEIEKCNTVLKSLDSNSEDASVIAKIAQAKAMRAWSYLLIAPLYQFNYATAKDAPCVPIVTETTTDFTHNPRATVAQVDSLILSDLDYAVEHLEGFARSDKTMVDKMVALGLRSRIHLAMESWEAAANDAGAAIELATAQGIAPVKPTAPAFMSLTETNWMWGYDTTPALAQKSIYSTSSSWIRSFSADGYSCACQVYAMANKMLYDMVPDTDARKAWWVDENLESPFIEGLIWPGTQQPIAVAEVSDEKMAYLPYTNVKFGCLTVGTTTNDEDWPWMRIEEMILNQVEGLYKSGKTADAVSKLEEFMKTYRDPSYSFAASQCATPEDEIWFQRRVELWGEGFSQFDIRRLGKPLVRFHAASADKSNVPDAFRLNMASDDPWWLMRFPTAESNTNHALVNNTEGSVPVAGQNGDLKDGVTDKQ